MINGSSTSDCLTRKPSSPDRRIARYRKAHHALQSNFSVQRHRYKQSSPEVRQATKEQHHKPATQHQPRPVIFNCCEVMSTPLSERSPGIATAQEAKLVKCLLFSMDGEKLKNHNCMPSDSFRNHVAFRVTRVARSWSTSIVAQWQRCTTGAHQLD